MALAKVILFDVDGTLVLTGGAGLRAMGLAFEELFGISGALANVPMAGRTDSWILTQLAEAHGLTSRPAELARFPETYLKYLPEEIEKPGPRKGVMPGVRELLDSLASRSDVHLALLTGNYRGGARAKLEYFDLWRYFKGGAFGDAALDRNALVQEALDAVVAFGGPQVPAAHAVIIGDTPLDVACAAHAGARSIAVATGSYEPAALRAAGADAVFEDLSETAEVVSEIDRLGSWG